MGRAPLAASRTGTRSAQALLFATLTLGCPATDPVDPVDPVDTDEVDSHLPSDSDSPASHEARQLGDDTVSVTVDDPASLARTYTLSTTHPPRDDGPSTVTVVELADQPVLRSGSLLTDALFALAWQETREASVSQVHDAAFFEGAPVPCPCFETGALWPWVWTRDTAYASHLALGWVDPERAWASLVFKLSERKDGAGGGELQIVQDTGSGGSWPVSADRVVWALGAARTLDFVDPDLRAPRLRLAHAALVHTLALHRTWAWDSTDGLYRGEQSFLDWREQSYAARTATDVVPIAASKALSTNVLHLRALRIAAAWSEELAEPGGATFITQADALQVAIEAFWEPEAGVWHSVIGGPLDPSLAPQIDTLGVALLLDIEPRPEALAAVPFAPAGPPVISPQQPFRAVYHNRAVWPFVTAYVGVAARRIGNPEVFAASLDSLARGAALNLSHMENLEFLTGANHLDDGPWSGPVVNSRRQLWSVAGFLGIVVDGVFGMDASGGVLRWDPWIPPEVESWLPGPVTLHRFPFRGTTVDVVAGPDAATVDPSAPRGITRLDPDADFRQLYAPVEPTLAGPTEVDGQLALTLSSTESDVVFDLFRDGERVAAGLEPGPWTTATDDGPTPCFALAARYPSTGTTSQHTAPSCAWGDRVTVIDASTFILSGGSLSDSHGRPHVQDWGTAADTLSGSLTPVHTGLHRFQPAYSLGGPIPTGITAASKWLTIHDESGTLAEGPIVMPHTGDWEIWADGTSLPVDLVAGDAVTWTLSDGPNMSHLQHHQGYNGAGGGDQPYGYVDIAAWKVLFMGGP